MTTYFEHIEEIVKVTNSLYAKRVPALTTAQREFNERKSPQHWFTKSLNLRISAEKMWKAGNAEEDPALLAVALMLNGMSIELFAKGRLIGKAASPIEENKLKEIFNFGHGLRKLVIELGLPLLPNDSPALDALEDYLTWAGRYPMPRNVEQFQTSEAEHGMPPADVWDQVLSIWMRLKDLFDPSNPSDQFKDLPDVLL